ncbi:hypothetical protein TNCV_3934771 [Trichonephila clavipes]|nr:hypothetical protein TNCV_3934771 [Trichonephila clavipes]
MVFIVSIPSITPKTTFDVEVERLIVALAHPNDRPSLSDQIITEKTDESKIVEKFHSSACPSSSAAFRLEMKQDCFWAHLCRLRLVDSLCNSGEGPTLQL